MGLMLQDLIPGERLIPFMSCIPHGRQGQLGGLRRPARTAATLESTNLAKCPWETRFRHAHRRGVLQSCCRSSYPFLSIRYYTSTQILVPILFLQVISLYQRRYRTYHHIEPRIGFQDVLEPCNRRQRLCRLMKTKTFPPCILRLSFELEYPCEYVASERSFPLIDFKDLRKAGTRGKPPHQMAQRLPKVW